MSIKLIAVDIDGTLLNSQRQVTPEVFQAIQDAKAAGVKVVIATGRPIPGVLPLLEELNLNQDGDYVITFNGGLVQETSTGNELIRETLSYEDYLDIEVLANKLGVHSHAITKDGIYTSNRNIGRYTVHESTLVHMPIYYRTPEEVAEKVKQVKSLLFNFSTDNMEEFRKQLDDIDSKETLYELRNSLADAKAVAVSFSISSSRSASFTLFQSA